VGDFNTFLSPKLGHLDKKKINKDILKLNDTIDLLDLTDIYRVFHPAITQYTFFSVTHGTLSKIDHTLGHKMCFNKYKKIEITSLTV
jgi:exonuclease III